MKNLYRSCLLLAAATALVGCAVIPYDVGKMTPEQLKAAGGLGVATYAKVPTPWGLVETRQTVFDVTNVPSGAAITAEGAINITSAPLQKLPIAGPQAACDDLGQAFVIIGTGREMKLLRTPAEDVNCQKPAASRGTGVVGSATDGATQAELDRAKAAALRGK